LLHCFSVREPQTVAGALDVVAPYRDVRLPAERYVDQYAIMASVAA